MAKGLKLRELAGKARRWLTRADAPAASETAAVVADRFDAMSWQEIYGEARALRALVGELQEHYDYSQDLVRDVWTGAYKADPQLRDRGEMEPGRLLNHKVIGELLASEEFAELRRNTVGDTYAAAMGTLAAADALRRLLEQTRDAQEVAKRAAERREEQEQAAAAVAAALTGAQAAADSDGNLPADVAGELADAIAAAEHADAEADTALADAEAAADHAAPAIRTAVRAGARKAADERQEEAELIAAWGIEPGQLERRPFEERRQLAERLRGTQLVRFGKLVGRFRVMAEGERSRKVERVPGELVGLTLGSDISRAVADELANLALPALRATWLARWAEDQMIEYDMRGDERIGQGAIIAAIDCSGSMRQTQPNGSSGEAWAKGCALALLQQAQAERRAFVGILFSSRNQLRSFRFPAGRAPAIGDVLDFAEFFWGGGTDFETPLAAAVDVLAEEYDADGRAKGDIVLISDGECGVSEEWTAAWLEAKHRLAFRLFGIAIARRVGPVMEALCDNVRSVDDLATPDTARELFSVI